MYNTSTHPIRLSFPVLNIRPSPCLTITCVVWSRHHKTDTLKHIEPKHYFHLTFLNKPWNQIQKNPWPFLSWITPNFMGQDSRKMISLQSPIFQMVNCLLRFPAAYTEFDVFCDKTQYKGKKKKPTVYLYGIIPAVPCFLSSLLAAVIIQNLTDENCQSSGGLRTTEGTLLVSSSFVCVSQRRMRVCLLLSATLLFHFPASRLFQQRRVCLSQRERRRRRRGGEKKKITPDKN